MRGAPPPRRQGGGRARAVAFAVSSSFVGSGPRATRRLRVGWPPPWNTRGAPGWNTGDEPRARFSGKTPGGLVCARAGLVGSTTARRCLMWCAAGGDDAPPGDEKRRMGTPRCSPGEGRGWGSPLVKAFRATLLSQVSATCDSLLSRLCRLRRRCGLFLRCCGAPKVRDEKYMGRVVDRFAGTVGQGMSTFLATGNIVSSSGLDLMQVSARTSLTLVPCRVEPRLPRGLMLPGPGRALGGGREGFHPSGAACLVLEGRGRRVSLDAASGCSWALLVIW